MPRYAVTFLYPHDHRVIRYIDAVDEKEAIVLLRLTPTELTHIESIEQVTKE